MSAGFDLTEFDSDFSSRMPADEWQRILTFRSLPHFLDGVRRHEGTMQPFFAHNLILNKVVTELWRFKILVLLLYLDATKDPDNPRTGLTLARLQQLCGQLQIASPGRINGYLNIMRVGGYLTATRGAADSRVVHYVPTGHFMAIVEEWNRNIWASIDAADPTCGIGSLHLHHPGLGVGMRNSGAEALLAGWVAMDPFPEVEHFASVDGGWLLMEHIVADSTRTHGQIDLRPVRVKLGVLGNKFGGSRSNLRRLLETAYEKGLLAEPPQGGANVMFSRRMACAFLTFLASFLGYFQVHTQIALSRILAREGG